MTTWQATPEQRRALRRWRRRHARFAVRWRQRYGDLIPVPLAPCPPVPLLGLGCGAATRSGGVCKNPALLPAGRCRMHGGRSTGPTSVEGKARVAAAARRRV
jgi:hypothetical protein